MAEHPLRIVAPAIQLDGVVVSRPSPARHHHLMTDLRLLGVDPTPWQQGFLASDGAFLTRWQARQLALLNGQCVKPRSHDELFSEDLW